MIKSVSGPYEGGDPQKAGIVKTSCLLSIGADILYTFPLYLTLFIDICKTHMLHENERGWYIKLMAIHN